jgi:pimeloyl-ACP methyl ester carboxylesterase
MRPNRSILALGILFLAACAGNSGGSGGGAHSAVALQNCNQPGVFKMSMPQYHDRPGSPTFQYAYEIVPAPKPIISAGLSPTIIYLPGGPGFGSNIGLGRMPGVPEYFNIIRTEQRGAGCSKDPVVDDSLHDFYTIDYMARDVLALIKKLGLTNYYIYGASFGTVHGTVLANLIEKEGLPRPKAVILESILADVPPFEEWYQGYVNQWARVKLLITPSVLSVLTNDPNAYGFTQKEWTGFITSYLKWGEVPVVGDFLPLYLNPLGSSDPVTAEKAKATIRSTMASYSRSTFAKLTFAIHCKELFFDARDTSFVNGELTPVGPQQCALAGMPRLKQYNSVDYPVTVPLYDFGGPYDPSTPADQAAYHYNHQTGAKRHLIVVGKAGHAPLTGHLQLQGCAETVWNAIYTKAASLRPALDTCDWPVDYSTADPL